MSPINPEPTPLSSSIDRLLKSLRGGDRQTTVTVFSRWAEIVGEPVCSHVKPLKLDAGTLIVEVDEPAWATQLKFLEADLQHVSLLGEQCQSSDSKFGSNAVVN